MDSITQGQGNVSAFVGNHYVRSSWIAFFTLWVLWGLSYFVRHAFGHHDKQATTAAATDDPEAAAGTQKKGWKNIHTSLGDRLTRAHEVLFENTLLLLSVLTLNTFGAGATRAVMILSWIFFAATAINAFTEVGVNHHFIRFIFNIIFFGVTLAIGGLSFSQGWW